MNFRLFTIVGARPQFVKAAALSRALQGEPSIEETLIHTGQHFDANMSSVFFEELGIPTPKYFLNIHGGSHGQMTGRMLESIEKVLIDEKPDAVLVYGDTNSTLAGALAASKLHIPLIHVEAGLRSYDRQMPEEINRVLTDHMSNMLFCPTATSVENLHKEGITEGIYQVGDLMYDATLYALKKMENNKALDEKFSFLPEKFAFMTIHREESTADQKIFQTLLEYAENFAKTNDLKIIFPVHPRIKNILYAQSLSKCFMLLDPLSYFETQYCLKKASYVLTDSGGLQKEAYFHQVPCITLRDRTEWIETIECGWNRLWTVENYSPRKDITDYGTGNAAKKTIDTIKLIS